MVRTLAVLAAFGGGVAATAVATTTAATAEPVRSYRGRQLQGTCRPPLKLAAGACVRRCPAGYRDTGRNYCRLENQSRP